MNTKFVAFMNLLVELGFFHAGVLDDAVAMEHLEVSITIPQDIYDALFPNGIDPRNETFRAMYSMYDEMGEGMLRLAVAYANAEAEREQEQEIRSHCEQYHWD